MCRTHFEEKVTLSEFIGCVFSQKVLFLIICGKNLTDECIGNFFLTDAYASIASAWIRPCDILYHDILMQPNYQENINF